MNLNKWRKTHLIKYDWSDGRGSDITISMENEKDGIVGAFKFEKREDDLYEMAGGFAHSMEIAKALIYIAMGRLFPKYIMPVRENPSPEEIILWLEIEDENLINTVNLEDKWKMSQIIEDNLGIRINLDFATRWQHPRPKQPKK